MKPLGITGEGECAGDQTLRAATADASILAARTEFPLSQLQAVSFTRRLVRLG
jgi:hypothetical protein